MILQLVQSHSEQYAGHSAAERLQQLDMSPSDYSRLRRRKRQRAARESAIPESDVAETVGFIIEHPDVGAGRAHLTLVDQERALISTAFISDARQQVACLAEQHYRERNEQEKLLEAELRARQQAQRAYRHIEACHPHHIWAIDFVAIRFLSFQLVVCVIYDVFSQAYLAIRAGTGCDQRLARRSLQAAVAQAGTRAGMFMRRDNGKSFVTAPFQAILAENGIIDDPIPPGQPWLNGSLESSNTSLKAALKTAAMQRMAAEPDCSQAARKDVDNAVLLLQKSCDQVRTTLNHSIARPKFGMPPGQVMNGEVDATRERHERFVRRKRKERKERMAGLLETPDRPASQKTFIQKVRSAFDRCVRSMTTDQLYVLNEAIHRRYQTVEV